MGRHRRGKRARYPKTKPAPVDAAMTHAIGFVLTDGVVTTLRIRA